MLIIFSISYEFTLFFIGKMLLDNMQPLPHGFQRVREFMPPAETLEKTLESNRGRPDAGEDNGTLIHAGNSVFYARTESLTSGRGTGDVAADSGISFVWDHT